MQKEGLARLSRKPPFSGQAAIYFFRQMSLFEVGVSRESGGAAKKASWPFPARPWRCGIKNISTNSGDVLSTEVMISAPDTREGNTSQNIAVMDHQ